jgi:hypothetical protein
MRRLLSYRDARLLVAGQTLSAFGDWAMWPAPASSSWCSVSETSLGRSADCLPTASGGGHS